MSACRNSADFHFAGGIVPGAKFGQARLLHIEADGFGFLPEGNCDGQTYIPESDDGDDSIVAQMILS